MGTVRDAVHRAAQRAHGRPGHRPGRLFGPAHAPGADEYGPCPGDGHPQPRVPDHRRPADRAEPARRGYPVRPAGFRVSEQHGDRRRRGVFRGGPDGPRPSGGSDEDRFRDPRGSGWIRGAGAGVHRCEESDDGRNAPAGEQSADEPAVRGTLRFPLPVRRQPGPLQRRNAAFRPEERARQHGNPPVQPVREFPPEPAVQPDAGIPRPPGHAGRGQAWR